MGSIRIDWLYVILAAFCELGRQTGDVVSYALYRSSPAERKTHTAMVKQYDHVTMVEILSSRKDTSTMSRILNAFTKGAFTMITLF